MVYHRLSLFIPWLAEKVAGGSSQKEKQKAEGLAVWSRVQQVQGSCRCGKPGQGEGLHQPAWLATLVTRAMLVVEWPLWEGRLRHSRVSPHPPLPLGPTSPSVMTCISHWPDLGQQENSFFLLLLRSSSNPRPWPDSVSSGCPMHS